MQVCEVGEIAGYGVGIVGVIGRFVIVVVIIVVVVEFVPVGKAVSRG